MVVVRDTVVGYNAVPCLVGFLAFYRVIITAFKPRIPTLFPRSRRLDDVNHMRIAQVLIGACFNIPLSCVVFLLWFAGNESLMVEIGFVQAVLLGGIDLLELLLFWESLHPSVVVHHAGTLALDCLTVVQVEVPAGLVIIIATFGLNWVGVLYAALLPYVYGDTLVNVLFVLRVIALSLSTPFSLFLLVSACINSGTPLFVKIILPLVNAANLFATLKTYRTLYRRGFLPGALKLHDDELEETLLAAGEPETDQKKNGVDSPCPLAKAPAEVPAEAPAEAPLSSPTSATADSDAHMSTTEGVPIQAIELHSIAEVDSELSSDQPTAAEVWNQLGGYEKRKRGQSFNIQSTGSGSYSIRLRSPSVNHGAGSFNITRSTSMGWQRKLTM